MVRDDKERFVVGDGARVEGGIVAEKDVEECPAKQLDKAVETGDLAVDHFVGCEWA